MMTDRMENEMNTEMPLLLFSNVKKEKKACRFILLQYTPINWMNQTSRSDVVW